MGQRQTGGQRAFGVCRTGQPQLIPVRQQLITKSGLVWTSSAVLAAEGRWPWGNSPWFGGSLNSRLVCVGGTFNLIPALRALSSPALWHPQSSSHTQLLLLEQDQLQTTMCCSSGSPPKVTLAPAPGETQGTSKLWRSPIQTGQRSWEQLLLLLQGWECLHSSGPSKPDDLGSPRWFMVRDEWRDPAQLGTSFAMVTVTIPSADSK